MNATFQYSLLKYHHIRREEQLTMGVLVWFPAQGQVRFLAPPNLQRIRQAFPDAPVKLLTAWLKSFEWQADKLSQQPELFSHYDLTRDGQIFVEQYFLPSDNSALQFDRVINAVQYTEHLEIIYNNLRDMYLSVFYHGEDEYGQKNNAWLATQYRRYIRQKNAKALHLKLIQENYQTQHRDRQYKFEFAWQNHTFNLVNTVSFDLKLPESIQRKGEQYYGKYALLQDFAQQKNARFDLLVARPASSKLYSAYDKAIEDITHVGNIRVIQESELNRYAEQTLEELVWVQ
jgi:hypothetical protein